jgi:carbamate kinase
MGPKVEAACNFASVTGKRAVIGALADLPKILRNEAGTHVSVEADGLCYW